jgi:predicted O-linked N-acetylglucosamine transferase (SPINDLY family)
LHEIADSKLLVKWRTLKNQEEQDRLYALFATHDIPKARLILRDYSQHPDCMAEYADVDIALDPFPYCGGLTSAEALWMGVPVITLPSFRPVSRQTYSFLQTMGLTELIANSTEEYIGVAKRLADDQTELNTIRMGMRERMQSSLMCDGEAFAHNMDNILRDIWKQACDRQRAKAALLNPLDSLIPS